jgi:dTDP-4-amino-4,6-dideoxygalactose transaminase
VTQPLLPDYEKVCEKLREIMDSKWLTNHGANHNLLEEKLAEELKVENVSLFNNGTMGLLIALKALNLPEGSEVITTPFTFAATAHVISWNGLKPVFCDIEPETMTIDVNKIEELITPNTSAILPVHVYGFPCDVYKIEEIAKKHNLKVIYDAAHAFSTEIDGKPIGAFGDMTMFSFHATKLFNTIEGGCLAYNNSQLRQKIYNLRNFGIVNEEEVCEVGINAKLNEIQSAIGLLNLDIYKEEQDKRVIVKEKYYDLLKNVKGIRIPKMSEKVKDSYQYFPIIIENDYPVSRSELYDIYKTKDIFVRKYFYPICSNFACYKDLPSSSVDNLPVANEYAEKVLCLPLYGDLTNNDILKVINVLIEHSVDNKLEKIA